MHPTHCLNCETVLSDGQRFCAHCGQKTSTHRLTWTHFQHEFFHALTHADRGILHLFKELVLRPGVVVREYLAGTRQKVLQSLFLFPRLGGRHGLGRRILWPGGAGGHA